MLISKQVIFFDMYSVIELIWVKSIMLSYIFIKLKLVCNYRYDDKRSLNYFSLVFGWGGQKGDEIIISRLRLKSLEDSTTYVYSLLEIFSRICSFSFNRYSALCETSTKVTAFTSETLLLNRFDCHD
jgi:hypothetical protein